ncbi:MAG: thioredoxin domain-containing protein, partial [Verrucomicrobiota bacterium]
KDSAPKHTNRLAQEKSPYLLQHQHNPVDWYPWGEEAFAKAREEDKPILLSVGYSTCHWCHVMERESFEDEATAEVMNKYFINIKLDREERPDVDRIYMTYVQALTGSGGWPMNVFLTPDLKPFYGGTYFPPKPAHGKPSWVQLLEQIGGLWKDKRDEVNESADNFARRLREVNAEAGAEGGGEFSDEDLARALEYLKRDFDARNGGWGGSPKFPRPAQPRFMLRLAHRLGDEEAIEQVLFTCRKMAEGGIYDHIGGGFARYAVDAKWLVPHFEKMLYDNAQLVQLYLDAYLVSGDEYFADVVRDILQYIERDMTHENGGFFSAEDAASEGKEGKFYCFTHAELKELLSAEEFDVAVRYFGVTEGGNFVDHSDPDALKGQNVLSIVDPELSESERMFLQSAEKKIFDYRAKRVRPGLDDKILTSWNGLMLGAVARAGVVLDKPAYLEIAARSADFLESTMWDGDEKRLYHRWREGARDEVQLLEDHAYLLSGLIDLYEATLDPDRLEFAVVIANRMLDAFYDEEKGGFFQALGGDDLLMRIKEDYDGAEPSGNSVAALSLLRLGAITEQEKFTEAAEKTLSFFGGRIRDLPAAIPHMLMAVDFSLDYPHRGVVAGDYTSEDTKALIVSLHSVFQPRKVVLGNVGPVEEFAKTLPERDGAFVYLCKGTHCEMPTKDVAKLREYLKK